MLSFLVNGLSSSEGEVEQMVMVLLLLIWLVIVVNVWGCISVFQKWFWQVSVCFFSIFMGILVRKVVIRCVFRLLWLICWQRQVRLGFVMCSMWWMNIWLLKVKCRKGMKLFWYVRVLLKLNMERKCILCVLRDMVLFIGIFYVVFVFFDRVYVLFCYCSKGKFVYQNC